MNSWQVALALTSPVVAILIAAWSRRQVGRSEQLKLLFALQQEFTDPETRSGRRLLHQLATQTAVVDYDTLDQDSRDLLANTMAQLNTIALCVRCGMVKPRLVQDAFGQAYLAAMRAATNFIDWASRRRGFAAYPYASALAAEFSRNARESL